MEFFKKKINFCFFGQVSVLINQLNSTVITKMEQSAD